MSRALMLAGSLKPDVKLGLSLSDFAQALDDNHRKKFADLRANSTTTPSASDVIKVTEELNREGTRRHRGWRPFSTKVGVFLSRIQSLASIGDVAIGGSQNLIASGVWCAVRMCLESVIGFLGYYEKISSVFMKLGTTWSLYSDFAKLFSESDELRAFLLEYLIRIVRLCEKTVLFSRKSTLAQFAASMLSSFDAEFNPLLTEIGQWGKLIEQKSNLLSNQFTQQAERDAIKRNTSLMQYMSNSSRLDYKYRLLQTLSPKQGDYERIWRRQRQKGTCYWIFETLEYQSWRSRDTSCVLWLNGSIGSGKTVTLANIVADIHLQQSCLYFFCVPKEPDSLKYKSFLGGIAYQILKKISADAFLWRSFNLEEIATKSMTEDDIIDMVLEAIPENDKNILVVDGIENCDVDEREDITRFIQRLMQRRTISLCCSGLPASQVQENLTSHVQEGDRFYATLNNQSRRSEIEDFIVREVERRTSIRPLDERLKSLITSQLLSGAQGMYLWVALQLEALLPTNSRTVVSIADIHHMLENLPKDLPEAYDQALSRVKDKRYGNNHFKVVAASNRPLTLDEFQIAVAIVPGNTDWNPKGVPLDPLAVVYACGGNLLEVDEEDVTTHRKLHVAEVPGEVIDTVAMTRPRFKPFIDYILKHHRIKTYTDIDITKEILKTRILPMADSLSFLPYARSNWLEHTRTLEDDMDIWYLWKILLTGEHEHLQLPWTVQDNQISPFEWAILNCHGALFKYHFHSEEAESNIAAVIRWTEGNPKKLQIGRQWLSDILAQCITINPTNWTTIKYFLDAGANPFQRHRLLEKYPIELLIDGLELEPPSSFGHRVYLLNGFINHPAVFTKNTNLVRIPHTGKAAVLSCIIAAGYKRIVAYLIWLGISVETDPPTDSPLGAAIYVGDRDLTQMLLKAQAMPSKSYFRGKPAVILAFSGWNSRRCQPEQMGDIICLIYEFEPTALALLNTFRLARLPLLCFEDNPVTVRLAIELGANHNIRGPDGRTPLHMCLTKMVERCQDLALKEKLSILLDSGANPNAKDNKGRSCMEIGVRLGEPSILRKLLDKGGFVNGWTNEGTTLLHLVAKMDDTVTFNLLLEYGASLDATDMADLTPLQRAGPRITHMLSQRVDSPGHVGLAV